MKRQVFSNLTTRERLTLLEQIFAPQGGHLEFASCALSHMDYLFDFENVNLIEMSFLPGDDGLSDLIETVEHVIMPDNEQFHGLGLPFLVHAIMPVEPITVHGMVGWMKHDEPIAVEHFVTTTNNSDEITLRIVFIKNEIVNKIAAEVLQADRINS